MAIMNFNVGIKAIVEKDGMFLLLHGGDTRNYWEGPGGRIDDNETVQQTLEREVREELPGISNVVIGRLLHTLRLPGAPLGDHGLFLVWYHVTADFPDGVQLSDEHESYRWCTREEAERLASPGVWEAIQKV